NSPKKYFEEPEWLLKFLELPFNKGISWFYMFNVLKNITNSSGLNHVCMILVALFSFQRTPYALWSSSP
ncbi:hypothetical protein, partial [Anaerovibrio lipolyticus]|uniref:hypothetical protein n=1 Tax=Anaerovibrio lipolyticus TaxID=82374 RepID=UPI0026E93D05